jgi:hypothetical protein
MKLLGVEVTVSDGDHVIPMREMNPPRSPDIMSLKELDSVSPKPCEPGDHEREIMKVVQSRKVKVGGSNEVEYV